MITELEVEIIDSLTDDFYGLWEFDWTLNGMSFPIDQLARIDVLSDLVIKGFIDVYYGRLGDNSIYPTSPIDALRLISDRNNWHPRTSIDAFVCFLGTTEKADQVLAQRFRSPKVE